MRYKFIHLSLFAGILLLMLACNYSKPKEAKNEIVKMTFGLGDVFIDSSDTKRDIRPYKYWSQLIESYDSVLNVNNYRTWNEFVDSITEICCKNRNPAIVLNDGKKMKKVLLSNYCPSNYGCVLLKEKNVIRIYDDSVIKYKTYSMDSFENILRRDIENNGKVPEWCDHPNKLIIYIDLSKQGLKALPNLLDRITDSYYKVTGKTNVRINLIRPYEIQTPLPEK